MNKMRTGSQGQWCGGGHCGLAGLEPVPGTAALETGARAAPPPPAPPTAGAFLTSDTPGLECGPCFCPRTGPGSVPCPYLVCPGEGVGQRKEGGAPSSWRGCWQAHSEGQNMGNGLRRREPLRASVPGFLSDPLLCTAVTCLRNGGYCLITLPHLALWTSPDYGECHLPI